MRKFVRKFTQTERPHVVAVEDYSELVAQSTKISKMALRLIAKDT